MARKRTEQDYVDQLEEEIRKLKSLNRHLQKQLKKNVRGYKPSNVEDDEDDNSDSTPSKAACPECNKADLIEITIANRLFRRCDLCGYRTRAIKL